MPKSKILSSFLVLLPATVLLAGQSGIAESQSDECRSKPGAPAPTGLHWYYRVDRANNRHCWYLHAQGMKVHSHAEASSTRSKESADEEVADTSLPASTMQPTIQPQNVAQNRLQKSQFELPAPEQSAPEFGARWVDLPRSLDLNTRETTPTSGYAAEAATANTADRLPPALSLAASDEEGTRPSLPNQRNFGSISFLAAAALLLLLLSEGLIRLGRSSIWLAWYRYVGANRLQKAASMPVGRTSPRNDDQPRASAAFGASATALGTTAGAGAASEANTEPGELRHALRRADAGLRPPRSFAPSASSQKWTGSAQSRPDKSGDPRFQVCKQSAFQRLKTGSFTRPQWAPL